MDELERAQAEYDAAQAEHEEASQALIEAAKEHTEAETRARAALFNRGVAQRKLEEVQRRHPVSLRLGQDADKAARQNAARMIRRGY